MRRLLMSATVLCLSVALVVPLAHATREVTVTPVDPSTFQPLQSPTAELSCAVGNTNPAAWAVSSFVTPPEEYALVFDPVNSTCANCGTGFQVSTINMHLQVSAAGTVVMSGALHSAGFPNDPSCMEPTTVECSTALYTVTFPNAGAFIIALPLNCDCAFLNYGYAVSIHFESVTGLSVDLVTDNTPSTCTSYNNYGLGWVDLVANYSGWPGNLKIWADATCCDQPIDTQEESMGSLKGKFRKE